MEERTLVYSFRGGGQNDKGGVMGGGEGWRGGGGGWRQPEPEAG